MAAEYEALRGLTADARARVADCRDKLGLRPAPPDAALAGDDSEPAPAAGDRVLEHWEAQVEAEEALRLLALLRKEAR